MNSRDLTSIQIDSVRLRAGGLSDVEAKEFARCLKAELQQRSSEFRGKGHQINLPEVTVNLKGHHGNMTGLAGKVVTAMIAAVNKARPRQVGI